MRAASALVSTYEGTDKPGPAIYREGSKTYLLYSVAGDSGIAIAELH